MAKEKIQVFQLEESWSGIAIFPTSPTEIMEEISQLALKPHRHDHYCCFFIESGYMNFNIDFQNLDITGPSLLVSCPGQVHQLGSVKAAEGWVLAFDAKFVDEKARSLIEQSFAKVALLNLDAAEKQWFADLLQLISSTVNARRTDSFYHQLIQTLINSFFYKTAAIFESQEDRRIQEYSSRSIEIAKNFQQLVKDHFTISKKPAEYASKLSITVSYLNDTVKSVTGFSATWFIQQEVFREAQRLLFYTDKSIKEIAFQLGYEDYKYFIRLFSKTVGTSPASFRKSYQLQ